MRLLLCLLITMLTGACSPKTPTPAEMIAAAEALDKRVVEASNKLDAAAFMATHWNSPNLAILDMDEFVLGWEEFNKGMIEYLNGLSEAKVAYTQSKNVVAGYLVLGQHKWTAEGVKKDG